MDEEDKKEVKEVGEEDSAGTKDDGPEPKSLEERKREAQEEKELLDLEDENKDRKKNAGRAEAGSVPEPKKKLTDEEYAELLDKGLVDPLSEDGFL